MQAQIPIPLPQVSRPRVFLTHPGKHYHFYQIARAATDFAELAEFRTGMYYLPERLPYSLLARAPGKWAERTRARLYARRRFEGIRAESVVSSPYYEAGEMLLNRVPGLRDIIGRTNLLLAKNALYDFWMARGLKAEADIAHCLWGCAWRTFARARELGVRTVLDVMINPLAHQYVDQEYAAGARKSRLSVRERAEIATADFVFSPSSFVSGGVMAMGFPRERIFHIPYGVAVDRFLPRQDRGDGEFRILFVGHLALRKGFQFLIEAFRDLRLPQARLTLIGTPVDPTSERVVRENQELFTWIPHVSYDELHHQYQRSDLFVFPSLAEGSALVTYEALACGLPSIVTENAGSVVRDGLDGYIVPVRDVGAIRNSIRTLYQNRALLKAMGISARQRAEEFTWEKYRERVAEAYRRITVDSAQ